MAGEGDEDGELVEDIDEQEEEDKEDEEEERRNNVPADKNEFNWAELNNWGQAYLMSLAGDGNDPRVQGYHFKKPNEMESDKKSDIELFHILQGHDLALFSRIRSWRHNSEYKYHHKIDAASYQKTSRCKILNDLSSKYGLHGLKPKIMKITTPNLKLKLEIVLFNFGHGMVPLELSAGTPYHAQS